MCILAMSCHQSAEHIPFPRSIIQLGVFKNTESISDTDMAFFFVCLLILLMLQYHNVVCLCSDSIIRYK